MRYTERENENSIAVAGMAHSRSSFRTVLVGSVGTIHGTLLNFQISVFNR